MEYPEIIKIIFDYLFLEQNANVKWKEVSGYITNSNYKNDILISYKY